MVTAIFLIILGILSSGFGAIFLCVWFTDPALIPGGDPTGISLVFLAIGIVVIAQGIRMLSANKQDEVLPYTQCFALTIIILIPIGIAIWLFGPSFMPSLFSKEPASINKTTPTTVNKSEPEPTNGLKPAPAVNKQTEAMKELISKQFAEFEIKPANNTQYILVGGRGIKAEVHGTDLYIKLEEIRLEILPDKTEAEFINLGVNIYPLKSERQRRPRAIWNREIRGVLSPEAPTEILQNQVFIAPGMGSICKDGCRARLLLSIQVSPSYTYAENTGFASFAVDPTQDIATPTPAPSKYWDSYYNRAVSAKKRNKFAEAEQLFKETLEFIEQNLGADHPATARTLVTMANSYKQQKKFGDYEQSMLRALDVLDKHTDSEVKAMLGSVFYRIDKELVARKLADFYWDQRRYDPAFMLYERAYKAAPDLDTTDYNRNLKLAFSSSGMMVTACMLGKWDIADKAMAELKERYKKVEPETQKKLDYWIRTGELRLKKRDCS